jgi:hypothetical protein
MKTDRTTPKAIVMMRKLLSPIFSRMQNPYVLS